MFFTSNPEHDASTFISHMDRLAEQEEQEQEEKELWFKKNLVCKCCGEQTYGFSWLFDMDEIYCEDCFPDGAKEIRNDVLFERWSGGFR